MRVTWSIFTRGHVGVIRYQCQNIRFFVCFLLYVFSCGDYSIFIQSHFTRSLKFFCSLRFSTRALVSQCVSRTIIYSIGELVYLYVLITWFIPFNRVTALRKIQNFLRVLKQLFVASIILLFMISWRNNYQNVDIEG